MCDAYKRLSLLFIMVLVIATTLLVCFIPSQFKIQLSNIMLKKDKKNTQLKRNPPTVQLSKVQSIEHEHSFSASFSSLKVFSRLIII